METETGGMWQLTSIRSQIVGYANRSCYCSIAVFRVPPSPNPHPLFPFVSLLFIFAQIFSIKQSPLFFSQFQEKESFTVWDYSRGWDMVGLSVVLEGQNGGTSTTSAGVSKKIPQVINKATMVINSNTKLFSPSALPYYPKNCNNPPYLPTNPNFLDKCFLCNQKLLLGKDIYMYK